MFGNQYDCQAAIVESLHASHKAKEIIEWFKYPKTMVYDLERHMRLQTTKKISFQNTKFIRSILVSSGHPSLSLMLLNLSRRTLTKA